MTSFLPMDDVLHGLRRLAGGHTSKSLNDFFVQAVRSIEHHDLLRLNAERQNAVFGECFEKINQFGLAGDEATDTGGTLFARTVTDEIVAEHKTALERIDQLEAEIAMRKSNAVATEIPLVIQTSITEFQDTCIVHGGARFCSDQEERDSCDEVAQVRNGLLSHIANELQNRANALEFQNRNLAHCSEKAGELRRELDGLKTQIKAAEIYTVREVEVLHAVKISAITVPDEMLDKKVIVLALEDLK